MKKALCTVFVLVLTLFACGVGFAADIVIGISMDAIESQFWTANQTAMKKTLDSMGIKYTEVIADGDAQKQNQQVETLISMGVNAIIIAPKDGTAIVSAVKKCNDAGIPVVMDNRAAGPGCVVGVNVASDNKSMAVREMEYIAEKAKKDGKTYKLMEFVGNLTDVNAVYRHEGVSEVVAKYPEIFTEVIEIPTEWKAENADSLGQAALQANPDINMIFTASDMLVPTVKSILQKFDKWYPVGDPKHITWATFDGASDAVNEIKAGYIDVVSVQNSPLQGELCVKNAVALANGDKVDPNAFDPGFEVTVENWKEVGFDGY
jgi:ABC-type sugar transport system substrate-binding protein